MTKSKVPIRYRKRKATRVFAYNPWNQDIEPGDLLVDQEGRLFRAVESRGRNKRDIGELTPKRIQPPTGMIAVIFGGEVYWTPPKETP